MKSSSDTSLVIDTDDSNDEWSFVESTPLSYKQLTPKSFVNACLLAKFSYRGNIFSKASTL